MRGLYSEGNLSFKIDWGSLIVGSKFTVFALFYFVFGGLILIWRADLTEGFLRYRFGGGLYLEGLIFGILGYFLFLASSSVYISLGNSLADPATPIQLGQLYPSTVSPGLLLSK